MIASLTIPATLPASPSLTPSIADDLVAQGWSEQQHFLTEELTIALAAECQSMAADGRLLPALVRRGPTAAIPGAVRGDRIHWLHAGLSPACDRYLTIMESLRLTLNRSLFLGLEDYESHFALYGPGTGYLKHLDRFRDDDRRTVSVVIYLNAGWQHGDGGALRLFPPATVVRDIAPMGSRMVLFLSADMPHEVLPATRERLSLAGWFRRR